MTPLFESFFLGGFECACQRLESGRRLDLLAATRHDVLAAADFARLRALGLSGGRDGVPWVRAERSRGCYDWSWASTLVRAAADQRVRIIWDLMHFGWPDDVDVFSSRFIERFSAYAAAFAAWYRDETDQPALFCPINEISFLAWAGGDVRCMNPFEAARGVELKVQLVRATIHAIEAIRAVLPRARFLQPEPAIHIVPAPEHPKTWRRVESDNLLQYQAWDMLSGRTWQELGGAPGDLDVIGVNFYPNNQFMLDGRTVWRGEPGYKPFSELLLNVWRRYGRPLIVSETGSEGEQRVQWLRYVADECLIALEQGCQLHGCTLYPIISHLGWEDGRDCQNGLWDLPDADGRRSVYQPLAEEIGRQEKRLRAARDTLLAQRERRSGEQPGAPKVAASW